jgi:hypothetical protein
MEDLIIHLRLLLHLELSENCQIVPQFRAKFSSLELRSGNEPVQMLELPAESMQQSSWDFTLPRMNYLLDDAKCNIHASCSTSIVADTCGTLDHIIYYFNLI